MVQELEVQVESNEEESVKYFVNGEEVVRHYQKSSDRKVFTLTVREILNSAGFTPEEDYELTRDADNHTFESLDDEVPVENGDHFTALFKGVAPVS